MKSLLTVFALAIVLSSCGQTKLAVVKSYGFVRKSSRGTMPVDDNNNPTVSPTLTQYTVYIETAASAQPGWTKAWINNQTFDIFATKVKTPFTVGQKLNDDEVAKLSAKPGNSLWQLELQEGDSQPMPAKYKSLVSPGNIVVQAKYKKQDVFVIVPSIVQLNSIIYP